MQRRTPALVLAAALSLATLAACGSSGGSESSSDTTKPKDSETEVTTTPVADPLVILVGNDDGYSAEGIDTLVTALLTLDDVDVTVVAPLTQQSGQGGKTTPDTELAVTDVKTKGGFPAKAVDGYPADAVNVAFDELGLKPDLVITGINEGQNLGNLVDISGTVGAARAAAKHGVPALATSQGTTSFDYDAAVPFILDWVKEHRDAIQAGDLEAGVTSMNIPSCSTGEIRGAVETEVADTVENAIHDQDCASTTPEADLPNDIDAFNAGFVTITPVPTTAND
ncbi:MAG TPA: 5'/3'-nucleotidase SurE [Acidimicrobiales bacterium]|jgi:5'-nucleotidase|nr:5'/3'-nucleotidase SurE [Acidimicrobiales bacterium]